MNAQQIINSSLWAALGDALGFVTELGDELKFEYRLRKKVDDWGKASWRRKVGGKYGCHVELPAGTYSDDTQLRLAVSRSITADGIFRKEAFAKIELPVWRAYALGAGVGSTTAADNLVKSNVNWNSNFFKTKSSSYCNGGGNGAAMRIQPHVWASADLLHPRAYLLDVVSDAIITHGHARGILGAAFHSICLAMTLVNKEPLSQPLWRETLPFLKDIPAIIKKDFSLSSIWLPQWETETGLDFSSEVDKVVLEFEEYFKEFLQHKEGAPHERYNSFARSIHAAGGKEIGSAVKTTVLASAAALLFKNEDPLYCLKSISCLFGSDTDTIATMAGALIGATVDIEPQLPIQDKEYIIFEAKRLHAITHDTTTENFVYPSILSWKAPRSPLEIITVFEQGTYVDGLSRIVFFGEEFKTSTIAWQWGTLTFGQTVLAKSRISKFLAHAELANGHYTNTSKQAPKIKEPFSNNPVRTTNRKHTEAIQQVPLLENMTSNTTNAAPNILIDEISHKVAAIEKNGFMAKEIGEACLYFASRHADYLYLAEFTSLLYKKISSLPAAKRPY